MKMEESALKVAFLCLGVMGYPMAGHLARAGHALRIYNRSPARLQDFLREHGDREVVPAKSPAEAAAGADFVLVCTGDDEALQEIALAEDGAFDAMSPGACFVDHTTASARMARRLGDEALARGFGFLDAPVSGGEVGAEQGILTIMVGGRESDYRRATPLFDLYARKHLWMGEAGSGQLTKMVNQICIAGLIQALSEGLHFARRSGLDASRVVDVISQGAAQSWQMDQLARTMLAGDFDFGFAGEWMRKDLGMALAEAEGCDAKLDFTAAVDARYAEVEARGGGRLDTSSLIRLLESDFSGS